METDCVQRDRTGLIAFVHIPKAAGTTLNSILARQYSPDELHEVMMRGMSWIAPRERLLPRPLISFSKLYRLKSALRRPRRRRVIHGHFDLSIMKLLPDGDLGFSEVDRIENVRRVAEVAKLMVDAGLTVMVALVSPITPSARLQEAFLRRRLHRGVRRHAARGVRAPRPEGNVRQGAGELKDFTGVDGRYDPPLEPEARVDASVMSVEESVKRVLRCLG